MLDAHLERHHASDDVIGHQQVVGAVAQLPLVGVVDLDRFIAGRPPAQHLKVLIKTITDGDGTAPIQLVVKENRHRWEGHVERALEEFGQCYQFIGAGIDARHGIVAPLRGLLEPLQVFFGANGHTPLPLEVPVGVFFATHELGQVLLGRLIGRQRDDLQTFGLGQHLDGLHRRLNAVGGDADVGTDDGPVLQTAHLANSLQQRVGPLDLLHCLGDSRALGKRFQFLHSDKVVHHQGEETLESLNVTVILGDFVQVVVTILRRRELVLQHRQAGHSPHQVGRRP